MELVHCKLSTDYKKNLVIEDLVIGVSVLSNSFWLQRN